MRISHTFPLALLTLLLLVGCVSTPEPPRISTVEKEKSDIIVSTEVETNEAEKQGDYLSAAREYSQQSHEATPELKGQYQFRTAYALYQAKLYDAAWEVLATINEAELKRENIIRKRLLEAHIASEQHAPPKEILDYLSFSASETADLPHDLRLLYHQLRAEAYANMANHIETVRERIVLDNIYSDEKQRHKNQEDIWYTLSLLNENILLQMRIQPAPDVLSGWLHIVQIAKSSAHKPQILKRELEKWQQSYPQHAANEWLLPMLLEQQATVAYKPKQVAVLLPLSGKFAAAGQAIRDGILAGYYNYADHSNRQTIKIYDTTHAVDIREIYQQALDEGAEFVIGPLNKDAVSRLTNQSLAVPTLALNYADDTDVLADHVFQFGLSPENEASQLADRIWQDGYNRVAFVRPGGQWGDRIQQAFAKRWQQYGQEMVEVQTYAATEADFSLPIRRLLNIDASQKRLQRLQQIVGKKLKYDERRRNDIDVVVITGFPKQARQLRPQLRFHGANDLPVYSTSHIYTGTMTPAMDRDMDGIIFCDMPWVLSKSQTAALRLREQIETTFGVNASRHYKRLYALGLDAYLLIPQLARMSQHPFTRYEGVTGLLRVDNTGRLQRQLEWAYFDRGRPVLINESFISSN